MPAPHEQPHRMLLFDEAFPASEQLPRQFRIEFGEDVSADGVKVKMTMDGGPLA